MKRRRARNAAVQCGTEGARIRTANITGTKRRTRIMGMTIRRNTQEYGLPAGIIEIELTDEEIEQVFRIQEKTYRLEDARNAIYTAYESEQIDEEEYKKIQDNEKFQEAMLEEYEKRFSCNVPENVTWEESLKEILKEVDKYAATDDN